MTIKFKIATTIEVYTPKDWKFRVETTIKFKIATTIEVYSLNDWRFQVERAEQKLRKKISGNF